MGREEPGKGLQGMRPPTYPCFSGSQFPLSSAKLRFLQVRTEVRERRGVACTGLADFLTGGQEGLPEPAGVSLWCIEKG